MKKVLVCLSIIILFSSCEFMSKKDNSIQHGKLFYGIQYNANTSPQGIEFTASLRGESEHLKIYVKDGQEHTVSYTDIKYLKENFEAHYDNMIDIYGTHTDIDNNGKVIALLYDVNEKLSSEQAYVGGFFNSADLFEGNNSNKAEVLHIECSVPIEGVFPTVIHEFQHLINCNMNYIAPENRSYSDVWLNEALSESTDIYLKDAMPQGRLNGYNNTSNPTNYFYTWDGALADYNTVSLFMYWLYLNGGGTDIFAKIAHPTSRHGDYRDLVAALPNSGTLNYGTFEALLGAWLLENEKGTYAGGKWKDSGDWKSTDFTNSTITSRKDKKTGNVSLDPGDAVITSNATTGGNTNIQRTANETIHITLNKDTNINGSSVSVNAPTPVITIMLSRQGATPQSEVPPAKYNIIPVEQIPIFGEIAK